MCFSGLKSPLKKQDQELKALLNPYKSIMSSIMKEPHTAT